MVTRLSGMLCALVTPMTADHGLDLRGLERLLDRVVRGGVTGVCPVGSTGEGPRLTAEQRAAVVSRVRSLVPARLPVVPAPSVANPALVAEEIERFATLGADAVLVPPPPHYALCDQDLLAFYEGLADASALPVVIYNFPALLGVTVAAEVVRRLAPHPRIIGIKDSSRDFEYTEAVLYATASCPDFAVLTGSDTMLLASVQLGGAGAIAASANLVPDLGRQLYDAARGTDLAHARTLQRRLFEVVSVVRAAGFPTGWKAALELAGVCSAVPAAPASAVTGRPLTVLRERLSRLGVL